MRALRDIDKILFRDIGVPHPRGVVTGRGDNALTIGTEGGAQDSLPVWP